MDHPELNSMEAFSRRALPAAEMVALSQHLTVCDACREAMTALALRGKNPAQIDWFPTEDAALHLSEEEIAAAAQNQNTLDADGRTHLAACASCRHEVDELLRLSAPAPVTMLQPKKPASAKRMALWPVWSGLVAAGIVFAVVAMHLHHAYPPANTEFVAALEDGGGRIGLNAQGELSSTTALPPEYSALLAQTLQTHRLPASPLATADANDTDVLRGSASEGSAFPVLSPLQEETLATPAFRWEALSQAESYRVAIYDENYKLVTQSPAIQQTSWTPTTLLLPGKTYTWVVKANTTSGVAQSPQPPEREAKFTVADASTLTAIDAAHMQYPDSHLLLAALYAKAGMTSMVQAEIHALTQENPGSPLVHDLSASIGDKNQPPSRTNPAQ